MNKTSFKVLVERPARAAAHGRARWPGIRRRRTTSSSSASPPIIPAPSRGRMSSTPTSKRSRSEAAVASRSPRSTGRASSAPRSCRARSVTAPSTWPGARLSTPRRTTRSARSSSGAPSSASTSTCHPWRIPISTIPGSPPRTTSTSTTSCSSTCGPVRRWGWRSWGTSARPMTWSGRRSAPTVQSSARVSRTWGRYRCWSKRSTSSSRCGPATSTGLPRREDSPGAATRRRSPG